MFPTEVDTFSGNRYEVIAWVNSQTVIYYQEFGSYQGEWLLVSKGHDNYFIYKGSFGSCSGCDSFEAEFGYREGITVERAKNFADGYDPFLIVPKDTMKNICKKKKLLEIIPKNIRDGVYDISLPNAAIDIAVLVKMDESMKVSSSDILEMINAEYQQRALSYMGYDKFIDESEAEILHEDGYDKLFAVGNMKFVGVRDSSTNNRYILRVPPEISRVRQGIAWTFNMVENQYVPIIET
jgi:hypothetical protein